MWNAYIERNRLFNLDATRRLRRIRRFQVRYCLKNVMFLITQVVADRDPSVAQPAYRAPEKSVMEAPLKLGNPACVGVK